MSAMSKAMLRRAIAQAHTDVAQSPQPPCAVAQSTPPACGCAHPAPAQSVFRPGPLLAAGGALVGVLALLGMVTAALLAVALTALALAVAAAVLLLLVKMIQKEMGR